jgi:hypothetical protein
MSAVGIAMTMVDLPGQLGHLLVRLLQMDSSGLERLELCHKKYQGGVMIVDISRCKSATCGKGAPLFITGILIIVRVCGSMGKEIID